MKTNNSTLLIKQDEYKQQYVINKNNMDTNDSKLLIKTIWTQTTVSY